MSLGIEDPLGDEVESPKKGGRFRGPLAWFAKNAVAANIVMIVLLLGGYMQIDSIKQEVFPEFDLDLIVIQVPYPGATPTDVEQGVVLVTEEAVRSIDGVRRVTSTASEGYGVVVVELLLGTDADDAMNDVKAAIDRVTSYPEDVERPTVFRPQNRAQVISLVIYGDEDEKVLKALAEKTRDELLRDERVTYVELTGIRPLEVSIEIPQDNLRRYNLTLDQVAGVVRAASVELPAGGVKTASGEVLLRTAERRDTGQEFEDVILMSRPDGARLSVGDVADVKDGFAETDQLATYKGMPAVMVNVFRTGEQTPLDVSAAVFEHVDKHSHELPPGIQVEPWFDMSEFYEGRIDLLLRNAYLGLALVLLVLGLFLEIRLAFWVTLGIPISFIGSLLILPNTDVSINMISLFAFIIVLGMVVDDAIIVGEAIYRRRQEGQGRLQAAVYGVKEVAAPVIFAVITTMIAYAPLLFVPGPAGKFFRVIPIVVMTVLFMSLIESLIILPAHLAHSKEPRTTGVLAVFHRMQQAFSRFVERHIEKVYVPVVRAASRRRYLTLAICVGIFIGTIGLVAGGRLKSTFLPEVEGDVIFATGELPYGTSVDETIKLRDVMLEAAHELLEENGGVDVVSRGVYASVGSAGALRVGDPNVFAGDSAGSHIVEVMVYMVEADQRPISASEFSRQWREKVSTYPGLNRLAMQFETGMSAGAPVHVELSHPDNGTLRAAAEALATKLEDYLGVYDVDDGFADGKPQLDLTLKPEARALGLTEIELARQIRSSFFGAEAVRQQRGRDELRVYVRLPLAERRSEYNVEELIIRAPSGAEIPLSEAAHIERGRSFTSITRIDGDRSVAVTSQVDNSLANASEIMSRVISEALPEIRAQFPGIQWSLGGEAQEMRRVQKSLAFGFGMAVLAMFALLAIAFRSYIQPIIILLAIPFGMVGAVVGHLLMGYNLSMMSMMGVVALSGIVVNDSLILIVGINRFREQGLPLMEAVVKGSALRFRPILLTSLTTFCGLAPMILETSVQARFLIPMAVSLGFGVMFATFITLLLVPAAYVILDDAKRAVAYLNSKLGVTLAADGVDLTTIVDADGEERVMVRNELDDDYGDD
jgi:multidrug efflux pump subunit AcrB